MQPGKLCDVLLDKHNIFTTPIVAPMLTGIRVSANVYTSTEEVDRFCDAVETVLRQA